MKNVQFFHYLELIQLERIRKIAKLCWFPKFAPLLGYSLTELSAQCSRGLTWKDFRHFLLKHILFNLTILHNSILICEV